MRVALVINDDFAMWRFRKGLITTLRDQGLEVFVITPNGPYVPYLTALGVKHIPIKVHRFISPISDLKFCTNLFRIFFTRKFDMVHNMTIKPNIYGALAARLVGVPKVLALVPGLGYAFFDNEAWSKKAIKFLVSRLYKTACKLTDKVWFQNAEDLSFFVESGLISQDKAVLIESSGINLQEFSPDKVSHKHLAKLKEELSIPTSTRVVIMMANRVVWSKGVKEFVEASEHVAQSCQGVMFLLVGSLDPKSPDSISETYLQNKVSGNFLWLGFRHDVKEILALADVVTLPSYYREGVPRVLLEAAAMGKPIVTTDNVGCREVVDEGENGFLVPVKDSKALASAIEILIRDSSLREAFGKQSRTKAQLEFDEAIVISKVLAELYEIEPKATTHSSTSSRRP